MLFRSGKAIAFNQAIQYQINDVVIFNDVYYVNIAAFKINIYYDLESLRTYFPDPTHVEYWAEYTYIPPGYGQSNNIEVFVGGYNMSSTWAPNAFYDVGVIITIGSYTYKCIIAHTSSSEFNIDIKNWKFFIGNIRLRKEPYKVHNVNVGPDSPAGDVQFDADFSVDGINNAVRLTNPLLPGTLVTIVQRTGIEWDQNVDIITDNTLIADYLRSTPGIWYS